MGNYAHIITDFVASGSFASLNENVRYYKEENYAILLRTCDFKGDFSTGLVYTDKHGYDFLRNSNLFGGEVILSNIGASIGKVFIAPRLNKRMTLAPNSIMVNLYDDVLNEFIYFLFLSSPYQNKLHDISASSAQAKFNKTDFKKIIIPIPTLNQQKIICKTLKVLIEKISNISKNVDSFKNDINLLKSKILDDIFGENSRYKSYYENSYLLGDILEYEQPAKYIVESTEYSDDYETPVLTPGKTFILGYTNEKDGIYRVNGGNVIIFDDFTTASRIVDFDFKVKSSAMKILTVSDTKMFNIEYLYYLLQTIKVNNNTHKRYWISEFATKELFVHTIEQQKEIVNSIKSMFALLDKMSSSI